MEPQNTTGTLTLANAEQLIEQLDALQPGKQQQKTTLFRKLYPAIERALAREVPQKAVIAELTTRGLPLSMGGFRSLLEAERKQRAEQGEYVCCEFCGSVLPASSAASNSRGAPRLASLIGTESVQP
ncbi:hypothetical protein [Ralstonia soli]|uniref:Uncharacterized protein n=1 Tax=Ralstonia soli TaxID=2953896 RepID=A0ABT1AMU6_9RALS|nr:hypothetical protein [Ralstonia soli]MCO5399755.1 hypothetical protein [Ralstonia soli]